MTLVLADRVKETTTSTGTTAVTLLGATTGFQSFSAVGNGNTTFYTISAQSGTAWEVGVGTYTAAGTTLSRDTVLASSNSGSLVNFTAGTKDVFVTYPAERAIYSNTAGTANYVPKFTSSTSIGDSLIQDNGVGVGIGQAPVTYYGLGVLGGIQTDTVVEVIAPSSNVSTLTLTNNSYSNNFFISSYNGSDLRFAAGASERMRIDSSGNVGIGTASPTTKLDVNGTTRFGATGADTITLRGQVSANSSVGTSGQVLTSQGANLPPQWTTPTSGTVTSVTATSPVASSGGTTPVISLPAATTSVSGYLTSTDWNTFNSKGSGTVTGTGTTNYLPKFTGTSAIGNSLIYDNGYAIGINTANPIAALTATISGCSGFFQKTVSSPQLTAVPVLPKNPTVCIVGDSASNENYNASLGLVTTGVATGSTRPSEIYLTSTRSTNAQLNASTFTPLLAGDSIGQIKFCGDNGVNLRQFGASINAIANTNWSSTNWDGYLMFSTTSTGGSVPAERMRIDSSGNVGIGTSSPIGNLNVYGTSGTTIRVSDGTNTNWRGYVLGASGGDSNEYGYLKLNANTGELRLYVGPNTYGGFQTFYTYGSERMRIDGSGNLGVGTSSPAAKLHVVGAIYATGNITAYYSDDRLKTRKGNIENALDKVLSLDGFHYEANETAQALGYKAKPEVGLSAQQVQAVLPEVVVPAPIDEKYLTVHYERLIPLLVEAMKEQQAQIEELRATISLLRGDIR